MSTDFERGYASTLSLLQRPGEVQSETVLAALSHYLAQLALPHQTSLTRAAVLSPLYVSPSCSNLLLLAAAFEHAVRQRTTLIDDHPRGVFSRSADGQLALWLRAVLEGTTSAPELIKISILGGVLRALHNLSRQNGNVVGRIENEVVVAFATVMSGNDAAITDTTRVLAGTFLQYVSDRKLAALDLVAVATFSLDGLSTLYGPGPTRFVAFLGTVSQNPDGLFQIGPDSNLAQAINRTLDNPQYQTLPAIARLVARSITIMSNDRSRRLPRVMDDLSRALESLCSHVEAGWATSSLSISASEIDIDPSSRALTTSIWTLLKTLLFSVTLISQSIMSVLVLSPHHRTSAPALASIALRTFASLSFVLQQFGGIAAAGGVPELRRVVFNALDVISTDNAESDVLVRALVDDIRHSVLPLSHPVRRAKTCYVLACTEQLVPVLSDTCLQQVVVPLCEPLLHESSNRDIFEAAHSTILAVLAWHTQRVERGDTGVYGHELVPGYVDILLQNAGEDGLRAPQLRLAVAGAARATMHDPALALFLVDSVVKSSHLSSAVSSSSPEQSSSSSSGTTSGGSDILNRGLMLASLLPALPPRLLPRVLDELRTTAENPSLDADQVRLLGETVYEEISERAGDAARAVLVRWWMDNASVFSRAGLI